MFRSIITLLFRNFFRNISFSLIAMSSLMVGLTTAILLFLWVNNEITFNNSIPDNERIYALLVHETVEGEVVTEEGTNLPLMNFLLEEVQQVEAVTRIDNARGVLANEDKWVQKLGGYADTTFFQIHITPIVAGRADHALPDNHSIALSQPLATLLFGDTDALGKTISFDRKTDYKVTAVYEPFPENSNFNYLQFILPYASLERGDNEWTNYDIKLFDPASVASVEQKIDHKLAELSGHTNAKSMLFPVKDWRLYWRFENGKATGGRIVQVIIFGVTGLFVLIMACINYMNIATARATKRTREIGVRKMTGATQLVLVRQFMTESLFTTVLAAFLSLCFAYALLPLFNQLTGTTLSISLTDPVLLTGVLGITLFAGLLAGSYPALLLSSFKPAVVLKGNLHSNFSGARLRRALVVFQFTFSIIIIFCSLVMWQQTDFLLEKDLGYDKEQVINVWLQDNAKHSLDNLKSEVLGHSAVESVAFSGASPMEVNGYAEANRVASPLDKPFLMYGANIDEDVLPTLKFEVISGRNFSRDLASDSAHFVITQQAANLFGFDDPIGEKITYNMYGPQQGEIIGVIKDFQNDDIHAPVRPVIFSLGKREYLSNMFVRYKDNQLEGAITHIKKVFEKVQPGIPVSYSFLDTDFENQFYREKLLRNLSLWFTGIAITIACLGLFGLVLFNTQSRVKEIGIRKVLGASVSQMAVLLCRGFFSPILYSFVFSFPIGYYLMEKFLEGYTSHITMSPYSFMLVGTGITVLVVATILYQSVKAAKQNPVESLKTE
jgi:putative ABC transport system permease protein